MASVPVIIEHFAVFIFGAYSIIEESSYIGKITAERLNNSQKYSMVVSNNSNWFTCDGSLIISK